MKKVKYTTKMFSALKDGTIIMAYKLANDCGDDDIALLYHPVDKYEKFGCSSVEFARWDRTSKTYKSLREDTYINLNKVDDKKIRSLIVSKKTKNKK